MSATIIRDELMQINQEEVWNSDKIERTEKFVNEFAIGFAEWLNINFKFNFTDKAFKELLEIYKNKTYENTRV